MTFGEENSFMLEISFRHMYNPFPNVIIALNLSNDSIYYHQEYKHVLYEAEIRSVALVFSCLHCCIGEQSRNSCSWLCSKNNWLHVKKYSGPISNLKTRYSLDMPTGYKIHSHGLREFKSLSDPLKTRSVFRPVGSERPSFQNVTPVL